MASIPYAGSWTCCVPSPNEPRPEPSELKKQHLAAKILWPFDARRDGFPDTVRDAGAWVMFDGMPYAHLHVCGNPWDGGVYERGRTSASWDMRYVPFAQGGSSSGTTGT
jgi:hypothetical protein